MDITLDCASLVGVVGGQLVSSSQDRFTRSSQVYLSLGHKGCCVGSRKKNILGTEGDKNLCNHQLKSVVVTNCL